MLQSTPKIPLAEGHLTGVGHSNSRPVNYSPVENSRVSLPSVKEVAMVEQIGIVVPTCASKGTLDRSVVPQLETDKLLAGRK